MNSLDQFIKQYEIQTNSHVWKNVQGMIADNAIYWFSDGSFTGHKEIQKAFEETWQKIQNETYTISGLKWLVKNDFVAVCVYKFDWTGTVEGQQKQGSGRGTNVIVKQNGDWKITHEHLSKLS